MAARVDRFSAQAFAAARAAAGLSLAQLAARVGTRKQAVWRWETGYEGRRPSPAMLRRLAGALGVQVDALLRASPAAGLAELRQRAGFTQAQFAAALGLSEDQWAVIERGRVELPDHLVTTAAAKLDVPVARLRSAYPAA